MFLKLSEKTVPINMNLLSRIIGMVSGGWVACRSHGRPKHFYRMFLSPGVGLLFLYLWKSHGTYFENFDIEEQ